jgi:hypothetical protein
MDNLKELAEEYNATMIETELSIKIKLSGRFRFKTFEGCDRYHLAYEYILEY